MTMEKKVEKKPVAKSTKPTAQKFTARRDKKESSPPKKAKAVERPDSLEANIGRDGYDEDGVALIVRKPDGSYYLTPV